MKQLVVKENAYFMFVYQNPLTLSSTAQVICDLAFLMLTAHKYLKQKNSEKIVFLEKCFLYVLFDSGLSPLQ